MRAAITPFDKCCLTMAPARAIVAWKRCRNTNMNIKHVKFTDPFAAAVAGTHGVKAQECTSRSFSRASFMISLPASSPRCFHTSAATAASATACSSSSLPVVDWTAARSEALRGCLQWAQHAEQACTSRAFALVPPASVQCPTSADLQVGETAAM